MGRFLRSPWAPPRPPRSAGQHPLSLAGQPVETRAASASTSAMSDVGLRNGWRDPGPDGEKQDQGSCGGTRQNQAIRKAQPSKAQQQSDSTRLI